jgi:hypothetical protein
MKTYKSILSAAILLCASFVFAQTSSVSFDNEASIWQKAEKGHSSVFTIYVSTDVLEVVKERYNAVGHSVTYKVESIDENTHVITMYFDEEISPIYLHKMLLYIGCESVVIGGKQLDMDSFIKLIAK